MQYFPTGSQLVDPFRLLEEAGLQPGMKVADFGCGTLGHYIFPAAKMVGAEGRAYAVDILKSVLSGVESRKKMENANNVEIIWGDIERENGVSIPTESLDIALLINNLFLSKPKDTLIRECSRTVKPGGKFVIVDWKPTGFGLGPKPDMIVPKEEARRLAEHNGLVFIKEFEPGQYHYGFVFRKV